LIVSFVLCTHVAFFFHPFVSPAAIGIENVDQYRPVLLSLPPEIPVDVSTLGAASIINLTPAPAAVDPMQAIQGIVTGIQASMVMHQKTGEVVNKTSEHVQSLVQVSHVQVSHLRSFLFTQEK
jgi:multisubunit Na+/H+ antiporter MnhE subunit